jgi:CBS domain-containing protein
MQARARDVMQTAVITVGPEASLVDVQRLFLEEGIGGAPVVDEAGRVVGVISAADVLRAVESERDTALAEPRYFRETLEFSGPDWRHDVEDFQDRLAELRVEDAMTRGVIAVAPESPAAEVARTMRESRVHRVLVMEKDVLVGIVSTFDLIALLERGS